MPLITIELQFFFILNSQQNILINPIHVIEYLIGVAIILTVILLFFRYICL